MLTGDVFLKMLLPGKGCMSPDSLPGLASPLIVQESGRGQKAKR